MRLLYQHLQTARHPSALTLLNRSRDITLAAQNKIPALSWLYGVARVSCHISKKKKKTSSSDFKHSITKYNKYNILAQLHDPFYYLLLHLRAMLI